MKLREWLYLQSPAGNRIPVSRILRSHDGDESWLDTLPDATFVWLASGTMAIACAVQVACRAMQCERPKVVVAAYGCPDIVAAIRFAGAEPLYVDVEKGRSGMSMHALSEALDKHSNIVAVLGADLFGIPERCGAISALLSEKRILLIQDFAQSIQVPEISVAETVGDIVIYSFGRGKPVSLLGGGLMAVRSPRLQYDENLGVTPNQRTKPLTVRWPLLALYNTLIRPIPYSVIAHLAGDRIGTTVYRALTGIRPASELQQRRTLAAVSHYIHSHSDRFDAVAEIVLAQEKSRRGKIDCSLFEAAHKEYPNRRFTRCPILVEDRFRERLIGCLRSRGVSATRMYARTLPEIVSGDKPADLAEKYPNALDLASRLVTLPVHSRMRDSDLQEIDRAMRLVLAS